MQLQRNNGVRLPNHYTHAKLEKVLPITSKIFIISKYNLLFMSK